MAPQILRAGDRESAPWKNGGGLTAQVAVHPPGAGTDDFGWRVSVADVAAGGPFSAFPGVERIITLVEGAGMELVVDGVAHTVHEPYEPFVFSGDADTECRLLGGPIVDFNVMVRRAVAAARVRVVRSRTAVRAAPGMEVLVVVLEGAAVLERAGVRLGRLDAVRLSEGEGDDLGVEGVLAVVELEERDGAWPGVGRADRR
ncbi:HutD family protein [Streptomyces sp. L2]|uniref:HutD/Ves family protein n=1 Tax=Streptomyces sp. L2 TaxID=2162665 RepID=UPI001011F174|nr:HutD family protein [Streptomyces sp. L2]